MRRELPPSNHMNDILGNRRPYNDSMAYVTFPQKVEPRRRLRLHDFPMWNHLSDSEMDRLLEVVTIRGYRRGELLFDPTDEPNRLYLLQLGRVKTYVFTPSGRKKMLHIFTPGDAFGALLLGAVDGMLPWAEAMQDVIVCSLGEADFKRLMLSSPNMCLDLFKYISQIHAEGMRRLRGLLHTKAEQRVTMALLDIGRRLGHEAEPTFTVTPAFTHEDIADMVGVVRTTVSEVISRLDELGIVSREKRQLIVHRDAAEAYLLETA